MDEYQNVFVVKYDNMRSNLLKDVRMHWRESKIFLGKNSVAQIALGRTPEDEFKDNLRYISEVINKRPFLLQINMMLLCIEISRKYRVDVYQ